MKIMSFRRSPEKSGRSARPLCGRQRGKASPTSYLLVAIFPLSVVLATPADAGIDAYGLLFGINSDSGDVVEFSTLTNATVGPVFKVGSYPRTAVFSPDGRYAYVANSGSDSVIILDVAARTIVATIPVGSSPNGIAISPDGQYVYATAYGGNSVSVISTATNQIVGAAIPVGSAPYGVAVSPDGSRIYVANPGSNNVSVINAATRTVVDTIAAGSGPSGVAVSPDGSKVYVANQGDHSVSVIASATNTVVATIALSGSPLSVAVSPDGARVYVTNQDTKLFVIDTAADTLLTTVTVPKGSYGVTVTPDGSRVYVSGDGSATIVDAATNTVVGTVSTTLSSYLSGGTGWIGPNVIVPTGGAVSAGSDAALTTLGFAQYVIFNGGTLQLDGSFTTSRTISLLAQGGVIDTNGYNLTLTGTIIKNGLLTKAGAGTLTLTGANTYTGGTLVSGGLINFNAADNFGTGAITLDGGGLQWATGNTIDISARLAAIGSNGGTFDTNGNNVTFSTGLSGNGDITKTGAGSLVLAAANAYTGATLINAGTLALSGAGSIAASSGVGISSGATFDISGTTAGASIAALAGVAGSSVALGSKMLTLSNASTTFAGLIAGTGGLTIAGGTETLTGANSYTGGTTVTAGTLVIGNAGAIGSGALALAEGTTLGFVGGNYTIANAITISGDPAFAPASGTVQTLTGVIADGTSPGTLEMVGAGSLVLAAAETYTGATLINAGTLALSGAGSIAASSGVSVGTGAAFDISGATAGATIATLAGSGAVALGSQTLTLANASGSFAGTLAGSGGLTLAGGRETLSGTNTYSGATTINGGTLVVNGSIANSATTVAGGATLAGTGTIGSVTVANGGTLAPGSGVAGTTLHVAGNLAFQSGALYLVQINPSAASSTISGTATLAGNVLAVFAPGSYLSKDYTILTASSRTGSFDGLTSSGLPTGFTARLDYSTPNSVTLKLQAGLGDTAGFGLNQRGVANALNGYFNAGGTLPPGFVSVFGMTGQNLANALTQLSGEPATGAQQSAFQMGTAFLGLMTDPFVDGRSEGEGAGALGYAPERPPLPAGVASAYAAITKAPPRPAPAYEPRWSLWGAAYGGGSRIAGDAAIGSNDLTSRSGGVAAGADYQLSPFTRFGFALAGGQSSWNVGQGLGSGRGDAFQIGVNARTSVGPAYLAASLAFANHWMSTDRMSFAATRSTASFIAQSYGGRLEAGWRIALPFVAVTPYAAVNAQWFNTPSYSETSPAGLFGLGYASRSASDTRGEAGARLDRSVALASGSLLTLRAKLAYAHDWISDPSLTATFQALPGASFVVAGAAPTRDSGLASVGAELRFAGGLALSAKFDGEFAAHAQTYAGTATLRYLW